MKNIHHISSTEHGGIKSSVSQSKNLTISQVVRAGALSCWEVQKSSYSHKCVKVIVLGVFVATMVKLRQFVINKPNKVRHQRRAAIHSRLFSRCYSASLSAPVARSQFLLAAHC